MLKKIPVFFGLPHQIVAELLADPEYKTLIRYLMTENGRIMSGVGRDQNEIPRLQMLFHIIDVNGNVTF